MSLEINVKSSVLIEIFEYSCCNMDVEIGGVLLGNLDNQLLNLSACIKASEAEKTSSSICFTADTWKNMQKIHEENHKSKIHCGWFHSHPKLGVYLSVTDSISHYSHYAQYYSVALVVDPDKEKFCFFGWVDGSLSSVGFNIID